MPYPNDDNCSTCGHPSLNGFTHIHCSYNCPECDFFDIHLGGCKQCKIEEFLEELDFQSRKILFEIVKEEK